MPKGAQPLATAITSRQVPSGKLEELEAGTTEASGRPMSSDSEAVMTDTVSHAASEEDMLLASSPEEAAAGAGPASSAPAEGETSGTAGTSTGKKRKTEAGPTPPQQKKKKKKGGPPLGRSFRQAEQDNLLGAVSYTHLTLPTNREV